MMAQPTTSEMHQQQQDLILSGELKTAQTEILDLTQDRERWVE